MRLGVALDLGSTEPVRPQLDRAARLLEVAERSGLTSVWLGESYHRRPEPFHLPASPLVLAHLSARTGLELGTAVLLARAHDPGRLAYELALLDQLCSGRLTVGIALGNPDLVGRFAAGPRDGQPARDWFESVITGLRRSWGSEAGDAGAVAPMPVQPGGPRLLIGGRTAAAAARAARIGDGYYAATNYTDALLAAQVAAYRAARGSAAPEGIVAVTRFCLLADTTADAHALAAQHFASTLGYYTDRKAWAHPDGVGDPELALVGSPADALASLRRYADLGVTSVQLRVAPLGTPPAVAHRTLELLGTHILPAFRDSRTA
jgi:alkanesulfonate monooxygenase SsuD/methylene tetrahydromethanopterin reductase-like flavin-dependent oxidoreductase (luciferase family)